MYKIIGADQKEYGPVEAAELRRWIQEGRANAQSLIRPEGSAEWRPLGSFSEFAAATTTPPPSFSTATAYPVGGAVRKTNGLAIAGLIFSLLGVPCCGVGLFSLLGLIFSSVALGQIKRNVRQEGRGMAIAGIIIAIFSLLLGVIVWVLFLYGLAQNPDRSFFDQT